MPVRRLQLSRRIAVPYRPQRSDAAIARMASAATGSRPAAALAIEPLEWREPASAFAPLARRPGSVFLDSALSGDPRARWSIIAAFPSESVTCEGGAIRFDGASVSLPLDRALRALRGPGMTQHPDATPADLPVPGLLGYLGYEAGRQFERMPEPDVPDLGFPDAVVGRYEAIAAFDMTERRAWLVATGRGREAARRLASSLGRRPVAARNQRGRWRPDDHAVAYPAMVDRAVEYIRAGDIFQANLTWRFEGRLPAELDPYDLYLRLRERSPAPFAAFLRVAEDRAILSASPERFLRVDRGGFVETRPIKGTIGRSADPAEDRRLAELLLRSAKDRAENLMIVDLMRNDLGRSCAIGSIDVPTLFGLESFPRIHHLVSVVRGRLAPSRDAFDLVRGAFPGGSITGAPKVRAMEIIRELEPVRRGPYCGSVIHAQADGRFDSSILIRTMMVAGDRVAAHAGGGIVADSNPSDELQEMRLKAAAMLAAVE